MGVALDRTEGGVTRRLPHGEVIVRQGDAVSSLFLVTAGAVRLSSVTSSGREIVVGLLCRGDLFGESALLGDPSLVRAQAVGPTIVLALPIPSLRATLERTPATAEELLRLIAARLHRTSAALEDAMVADLPTRVVGRLRELADDHGVHDPNSVRTTYEEGHSGAGGTRQSVVEGSWPVSRRQRKIAAVTSSRVQSAGNL